MEHSGLRGFNSPGSSHASMPDRLGDQRLGPEGRFKRRGFTSRGGSWTDHGVVEELVEPALLVQPLHSHHLCQCSIVSCPGQR
eukprot:3600759-Rhodomonas_salina.2